MGKGFCVWQAVDSNGRPYKGVWDISDVALVRTLLYKRGYYPVSIRVRHGIWVPFQRDAHRVWSHFIRKLAALLESGIPLLSALEIITQQENHRKVKQLWQNLRDTVATGIDLSEAIMTLHPSPPVYVQAMIKAGERSGELARILGVLADELEQEEYFSRRIQSSLTYPLTLFWAVLGVMYALGNWVLPIYEKLFDGFGAELPRMTRFIFMIGRGFPVFLWFLGILTGIIVVIMRFRYARKWKEKIRQWSMSLPVWGKIFRLREVLHFSRIMGTLLQAGIVFDQSLRLAYGVVSSLAMEVLVNDLLEGIRQGKNLAPIFRKSTVFSVAAREMLSVAEETGQWDKMFLYLAKMIKVELEDYLEKTVRLIEPVSIVGLAGLIGLTALGVLLPVFDASTHLQ